MAATVREEERWAARPVTRRTLLCGAGLIAAGAVVSACSGTEPDARTVEDFGAKGDGRTDDTAALQRALEGVAVGGTLALTRGRTYLHSDVLTLTVADVVLTGGGTLLATQEERSALRIEADGVTLDGVAGCARHHAPVGRAGPAPPLRRPRSGPGRPQGDGDRLRGVRGLPRRGR